MITINPNLNNIVLLHRKMYVYDPKDLKTKDKFWNIIRNKRVSKIESILQLRNFYN